MYITYVIGDIHGDFKQLCNILYIIGIIKNKSIQVIKNMLLNDDYTNIDMNNKKLIQLGDILDSKSRTSNKDTIIYSDMLSFIFLCKLKIKYPTQVILIIGNHEYLNFNKIYNYISTHSTRNINEYEYIKKNYIKLFQYYYIDKFNNLYIHSSIPIDINTISDLDKYEKDLKKIKNNNNDIIKLYEIVFKRDIPLIELLNKLNINNVFMGHTPHDEVLILNERIYYIDTFISECFFDINKKSKDYKIVNINNNNKIEIIKINRS